MPVKKNKKTTKIKRKTEIARDYSYDTKSYKFKQILMWLGVAALAGTVIFMWFLNANATFYDINKNLPKSEEVKILNESTKKIKEILTSGNIKEQMKALKILEYAKNK